MGTVTLQWRCRPVSLGQTCSERREEKEEGRGGGAEGVETVGEAGGAGVKKQGKREKKRRVGKQERKQTWRVLYFFSLSHQIHISFI